MREELRAVGKRGRQAKIADREAGEIQGREKEVSMRKVIASEFVSLDGVMEDPSWTFQFSLEEQEEFKYDELAASDALLLGRVTYEGFAAAWPHMREQAGEYADMMNGYPKHVVSTTLEEPLEWNNSTLIKGNVAEAVSRLMQQPGKDILIFGSGDLVSTLLPTRPHRPIPAHGLSHSRGEREASLQRRERYEGSEARRDKVVRFGRRCSLLPAGRRPRGSMNGNGRRTSSKSKMGQVLALMAVPRQGAARGG